VTKNRVIRCMCGHPKDRHANIGRFKDACVARFVRISECFCEGYVADNLKYLEDLTDDV
jgi:hypothetical protein